ncbi:MAG TPA: DUF2752 domain-containing protein [Gemmataceae bacterium]|nr:DUF2752 domain-containing protein [Gemmataceae bacterium]
MRWLIVAVALVSPAAAALLYFVEPTESSWYPKCMLHDLTGLHCPFCGTTRCGHALLNGDIAQAAAWNVVSVLLLPAAMLWLYWGAYRAISNKTLPNLNPPNWLLRALVVFLLVFCIIRNLPFWPCELLAPHRL